MSATVSDLVEHDENLTDDATIFEESSSLPTYVVPVLMPGSELNVKIRSFNEKQQQLFNILQSWAKQHIKNKSVSYPSITEPLHIFLKVIYQALTKVIYQALTETLSYGISSVDKAKVLLMAPKNVAAINVDDTTIHTALNIPISHFWENFTTTK